MSAAVATDTAEPGVPGSGDPGILDLAVLVLIYVKLSVGGWVDRFSNLYSSPRLNRQGVLPIRVLVLRVGCFDPCVPVVPKAYQQIAFPHPPLAGFRDPDSLRVFTNIMQRYVASQPFARDGNFASDTMHGHPFDFKTSEKSGGGCYPFANVHAIVVRALGM
jgi:hypothetical protein